MCVCVCVCEREACVCVEEACVCMCVFVCVQFIVRETPGLRGRTDKKQDSCLRWDGGGNQVFSQ